jgi:hypothetical protein
MKCPECNSNKVSYYIINNTKEYQCNKCDCAWVINKQGIIIEL